MLLRTCLPALALVILGCSSGGSTTPPTKDAGAGGADAGTGGADAGPAGWKPGVVRPSIRAAGPRGMLDLRGLIHAHSVYSHDACDGAPRDDAGAINQPCFDDFRKAICRVGHDYVMLTDHDESFGRTEYPDTLLYRADRGDELILRDGQPVANHLGCPDGAPPVLLLAGTESAAMPVGLEGHVPGTVDERMGVYGDVSADAMMKFKAQNGVTLAEHTENWTVDQLTTLPFDGFEMYNVHANFKSAFSEAIGVLLKLSQPDQFPQSDLILLPIFQEDPVYLSTWATVLAGGARRVTTMATDCHQNSFPQMLPDGERGDSYRRMMAWFSNHLLVTPDTQGNYDDRSLKDALRAGRLYGAFEVMGYPLGFDWRAEEAGSVREMGAEVSLAKGVSLKVARPHVDDLDPAAEAPRIVARILRAEQDGSWTVAAAGEDDLAFTPTAPGAYRAEVRMTPRHLRKYLASYGSLADNEFPWIYGNAIYVVP